MKIFYLILFNILALTISAQRVDFSWSSNNNTLCAPQPVTFQNTSEGTPTALVWRFGNGKSGNRQTERVVYTNGGTYEVTLIAIYGEVAITKTKTITINNAPTVSLTSGRSTICKADDITFNVRGSNDVINYTWDFGDNSSLITSTNTTQTHRFEHFENYTVAVKATNQFGCTASATKNVKVQPIELSATMSKTSGCVPAGVKFRFSATYIAEDMLSQAIWDFGDGTSLTNSSNNINHVYTSTNDITNAKLKIISNMGCEATVQFPKFAFGIPPTDLLIKTVEPKDSFCSSENIEFLSTATNANYYVWNWTPTSKDSIDRTATTHRFRTLENNTITVVPYMNGCAGISDSLNIYIKGVVAGYDVRNTCSNKNEFTFPSRTRGNVSHLQWTYGGSFAEVKDTVSVHGGFTYPLVGSNFVDQLVVDDITGCRDSLKTEIFTAQPIFTVNKNAVCKDSALIYNVLNDYPEEAKFKYIYNINGQTIDSDTNYFQFNPSQHGIYEDFLVIRDNFPNTCNDTLHLANEIKVRGPIADFESPSMLCFDTLLHVQNNSHPFFSDEPISVYDWNFGNYVSHEQNPDSLQFDGPGSYPVILTVGDINGCKNKKMHVVKVNPLPKVNILPGKDTICLGGSVELIAYSSDSIFWFNNPDVSCRDCDTIVVRPRETTQYIATAVSEYGCRNTDISTIKVYEPIRLTVNPSDTAVCTGTTFQYLASGNGIAKWEPATGLSNSNILNPFVTATNDIEYKVSLRDSGGCFSDSAIVKLKVHALPTVDAGPDKVLSFGEPFTIHPVYSSGINSYSWTNSPVLNCINCPSPSGVMQKSELLTITVEDIYGCTAKDNINLIMDCSTSKLFVPTAFTPNGDGLNDYFFPMAEGYETIKSFCIFDRSGNKVFERTNFAPNSSSLGWDGTVKGVKPNSQSYIWMAQVVCQGNIITKKGVVTLVR